MMKTNSKKVVFWIGAGASAQVLPVVSEMAAAMIGQATWVRRFMQEELGTNELEKYSKYLAKLTELYLPYGTVDTYARALFVQERWVDLAELKLHLALFILLEQVLPRKDRMNSDHRYGGYSKQGTVDPRYMGLLALFVKGNKELVSNVNIVSWNYDTQVEFALARYWQLKDIADVHSIGSGVVHPGADPNSWTGKAPFLIHLNGIAGHLTSNTTTTMLYGQLVNPEPKTVIKYMFDMYKDYDNSDGSVLNAMVDTLTFAWEAKAVALVGIEQAKRVMRTADILVVIGYSFPAFNRSVDKELFAAFVEQWAERKKVYIQNPDMAVEAFQQMMGIGGQHPNVHLIKDTAQFHIPYDIF